MAVAREWGCHCLHLDRDPTAGRGVGKLHSREKEGARCIPPGDCGLPTRSRVSWVTAERCKFGFLWLAGPNLEARTGKVSVLNPALASWSCSLQRWPPDFLDCWWEHSLASCRPDLELACSLGWLLEIRGCSLGQLAADYRSFCFCTWCGPRSFVYSMSYMWNERFKKKNPWFASAH